MNVNWTYQVTGPAERELRKLPKNEQERIVRALRQMVDEPFAGDVRKLRGQGDEWRLRVGVWRIR